MKKLLQPPNLNVATTKKIVEGRNVIVRKLAATGTILAKVGDLVKPEDVVAVGAQVSGFRSIPVAAALGVAKDEVLKFLKVAQGESVYPEQILATRKRLFGSFEVKSPVEGIVAEYNLQTGNLLIRLGGKKEKLTAACWGKVLRILKNSAVEIETNVLKIFGVEGLGRTREGEFKVFIKPHEFLLPEAVTADAAGKIIFGGARITKAALGKAISLGVSGIVAGGIYIDDFFRAGGGKAGPMGLSSDVGVTLILLEGFGLRPVADNIYDILSAHSGKFTIIDGDKLEVIFPKGLTGEKQFVESESISERTLQIGDQVRITDPVNLGVTGKVVRLPNKKETTAIGLKKFLVEIETPSGKMVQPYNNLEIID